MDWINLILIPAIKSVILVIVLLTGFAYLTWVERKLICRFQQRIGPNRAWKFGLGHPIADALKMIFKEETIPSYTDKILFVLGPALAIAPALLIFAVVPVGPTINLFGKEIPLVVADVNVGILWVLAVAGLGTYGIILGGWASNNKYSLLGALRTSSQMLSYELPMGILLIAILLVYGTLNLNQIVTPAMAIPWYFRVWLLLAFPFYFITMLAETSRKPFDFPETENELVAGFQTEYGSIKFALVLHDRVPAHPGRQRRGGDAFLRRLARAVRGAGSHPGAVLLRGESTGDGLPVHLGERQRPAAALRSTAALLLDVSFPGVAGLHGDYGGDGGVALEVDARSWI